MTSYTQVQRLLIGRRRPPCPTANREKAGRVGGQSPRSIKTFAADQPLNVPRSVNDSKDLNSMFDRTVQDQNFLKSRSPGTRESLRGPDCGASGSTPSSAGSQEV